ncbi:MAG TPA: nucleotidyltransferase family protein [Gemmatimonadota bacterium]|nr:nucleotidyltransferase family protein [Gemmatimonadota bacterium]
MSPSAAVAADPAREIEALRLCARRVLDEESGTRLRRLAEAGLDWDGLHRLAWWHGILPLVARHAGSLEEGLVPPAARAALRGAAVEIARRNLVFLAELFRVLDRLMAESIPAIPLKGPVLAVTVYGDLALREFTDLDVLVDRNDALRARGALADLGYVPLLDVPPAAESSLLRAGNAIALERASAELCVEVHWRFFPRHFRFPLEATGPLERLETVIVQGREIPQLAPEDQLLFLCAHGFRHAWERLEWVAGVAELVRGRAGLDWEAAVERAERLGGRRLLGLGLHLAAEDLDAPVPVAALAWTADPAVLDLAARVRSRWSSGAVGPLPRAEETRFRLRGRERFRDRAQYLFRLATTPGPADWGVVRLGRGAAPLYGGIRLVRLGLKYSRRVLRRG